MRKSIVWFAGLLVLALLAGALAPGWIARAQSSTPAAQSGGTTPRTISVTGSGTAYLDPDIAYIYIGVHTENEDAKLAVDNNNASAQKVIDALIAAGIAAKDIQTTNFSIYPQQNYDSQGKVTSTHYSVDNTVYVTLRNLAKLGDTLSTAINAGANSINGIQFDVADRTAALSEARRSALANAGEQARELAQAAGLSLGDIQQINTSVAGSPIPFYAAGMGGRGAADVASVPVNPGQLVVTVDVNVVYTLR